MVTISVSISFAEKSLRNHKIYKNDRVGPYVPMGEQRFQELLSELGAAFAQVDDGEQKRLQASERERQHDLWMAQREAIIEEIVMTMHLHGLSVDDLA